MQKWAEIRRRVLTGEISKRCACREYEIHWDTLEKILAFTEPPGYRSSKPRGSKVDPFLPIIQEILESDKKVHRKQRYIAQRIFERLRDEHGFTGGRTIVSDAVRKLKHQNKEVFFPLSHPPGEAQVDFGFADVLLWSTDQGCVVRDDAALFGCDLHPGISQRVHRILSGRTRACL
jgi:hypothetical protein